MSREFESLIFDPDLLDEGVDVSGLRTQTETNPLLLGDVQPGVKFDPTLQSTYSDLLRFFGSGLPMLPEGGKVVPPATETPGTGGGGQVIAIPGAIDTLVTPTNTAEDQRLIDAGIGLQIAPGQPVVAPGEIPRTQDFLDEYNIAPGANVIPTDPRTMLPQMGTPQEFEFPMGGGAALATLPSSTQQPIDPLGRLPQLSGVVTQKDVDEPETFLEKIGLGNLDVEKAAVMTALNAAVGKPVSIFIEGLKAVLPEQDPRVGIIDDLYTRDDIGRVAPGELMAGYNPVSGGFLNTITGGRLGTPTQYGLQDAYQERIDTIEESLNKFSKYDITSPDYDAVATKQQTDKLAKLKADKKKEADALGITAAEDKRLAELEYKDFFGGDIDPSIPPAATTIKDDPIEIEELGRTVIDSRGIPVFIRKEDEDALRKELLEEEIRMSADDVDQGAVELGGMDTTPSITTDRIGTFDADTFDDEVSFVDLQPKTTELTDSDFTAKDKQDIFNRERQLENEYMEETGQIPTEGRFLGQAINEKVQEKTTERQTITPLEDDFESLVESGADRDPAPSAPAKTSQGVTTAQFQALRSGGADRDPAPSAPSQPDYSNVTTASAPPGRGGGSGGSPSQGGGSPGAGSGCVIATHAVNSGAFTKDTKREAVRWCVKNLHRTWWGEAIRRGYRYYGQKAIDEGNAKNHYQEFKDYVAFGTGKRRTLKTAWTFVYRTVQFFIKGLFNAKR